MSEATEHVCPACGVERADYEGPNGAHLPECPNCGVADVPVPYDPANPPPDDVAELIDELCADRAGGGACRDDQFRLNVRRALMRLIDDRIEGRVSQIELDDIC